MLGAIAGDVPGLVYEAQTTKDKDFRLFHEIGKPMDDSILSAAARTCPRPRRDTIVERCFETRAHSRS